MVNAEYPVSGSAELIDKSKRLIESLDLKNKITMITDFLQDEISLAYLEKANLVVFSYQNTGESASGAIRYGLASKRPVAVTPLPIFDDVASAVFQLPGITPEDIAQGIKTYISRIKKGDEEIINLGKRAEEWRKSHLYPKVAERLSGILIALQRK